MPYLKDYVFSDKEKRDILEWYKQFNEMCNKEGIALDQGIGFDRIREIAYDKNGKAGLYEAFGKKGLHPEVKFPAVKDLDKIDAEGVKLLMELKDIMSQGNLYMTPTLLKNVNELRKLYLDGEGNPVCTPPGVKNNFPPHVREALEVQIEGKIPEHEWKVNIQQQALNKNADPNAKQPDQQINPWEDKQKEKDLTDEERMRLGMKREKPFESLGEIEKFLKISNNPNPEDACDAFRFIAKYSQDHSNDKSVLLTSGKLLNEVGGYLGKLKKEDSGFTPDISKADMQMAQKTMVECKAIINEQKAKEVQKVQKAPEPAPILRPDPVFGGPVLELKREQNDD